MANTTFTGPVTAINGFIGGPNVNAGDTQQGGTTAFATTNASTITNGTETLSATTNEGVFIYVSDGFSNAATYAFSDGTTWKRVQDGSDISKTA